MWKSSQKWSVPRSASLLAKVFGVRSIAWLGVCVASSCGLNVIDICDLACPHAVAAESSVSVLVGNVPAEDGMRLVAKPTDDSNDSVVDGIGSGDVRRSSGVVAGIPNDRIKPNRPFGRVRTVRAIFASYETAILGCRRGNSRSHQRVSLRTSRECPTAAEPSPSGAVAPRSRKRRTPKTSKL